MERKEEGEMKITIIGDGGVGKTCLLTKFTTGRFSNTYVPTVLEQCRHELCINGVNHKLFLCDTAGQEEYDRLRSLAYPGTDVFIICYAVNDMKSFMNITSKWFPEVKHHNPYAAIVLVGTKSDTKKNIDNKLVSDLTKRTKANAAILCSAQTNENIHNVFVEAVMARLNKPTNKKRKCVVM